MEKIQADRWIDEQTHRLTEKETNRWIARRIEIQADRQI